MTEFEERKETMALSYQKQVIYNLVDDYNKRVDFMIDLKKRGCGVRSCIGKTFEFNKYCKKLVIANDD